MPAMMLAGGHAEYMGKKIIAEKEKEGKAKPRRKGAKGSAAAANAGQLQAWQGMTDLFIRPPYQFAVVDSLITNFHLPKSSLLVLVSALAGREPILNAYRTAVENEYRFFSYGDAMMII